MRLGRKASGPNPENQINSVAKYTRDITNDAINGKINVSKDISNRKIITSEKNKHLNFGRNLFSLLRSNSTGAENGAGLNLISD